MPTDLAPGEWNVNCCDGVFSGNMTAHCTTCHATFTRQAGFDKHRSYGKCLDPALMRKDGKPVFRDAGRKYPCWQFATDESPNWSSM